MTISEVLEKDTKSNKMALRNVLFSLSHNRASDENIYMYPLN